MNLKYIGYGSLIQNVKSSNFGSTIMRNQQKRRKEKEGKGFGSLPSLFFPPFLLISHNG